MTTSTLRLRVSLIVSGAVAATALVAATAPTAGAALYFGALAYSGNGSVGTSFNYPTRPSAESASLDYCGFSDCEVLASFTDCGAVAYDGVTFQGGVGPNLAAAQRDAIAKLGGGIIDSWTCNG